MLILQFITDSQGIDHCDESIDILTEHMSRVQIVILWYGYRNIFHNSNHCIMTLTIICEKKR